MSVTSVIILEVTYKINVAAVPVSELEAATYYDITRCPGTHLPVERPRDSRDPKVVGR